MLRRMLGLPQKAPNGQGSQGGGDVPRPPTAGDDAETQTVRRIVAQLEAMPPEQARFLAGFSYVLARAADADLSISDDETREMERIVVEHGHLPEAQAVLVVEMAKSSARLIGATEDYLVTREFVRMSTPEQRLDLLRCCYLVGSADGTINAEETGTLSQIADELQVDREQLTELRRQFADKMSAVQAMRNLEAGQNP